MCLRKQHKNGIPLGAKSVCVLDFVVVNIFSLKLFYKISLQVESY